MPKFETILIYHLENISLDAGEAKKSGDREGFRVGIQDRRNAMVKAAELFGHKAAFRNCANTLDEWVATDGAHSAYNQLESSL
eukprot:1472206-Pyramimonas_sp.AAC.1